MGGRRATLRDEVEIEIEDEDEEDDGLGYDVMLSLDEWGLVNGTAYERCFM